MVHIGHQKISVKISSTGQYNESFGKTQATSDSGKER